MANMRINRSMAFSIQTKPYKNSIGKAAEVSTYRHHMAFHMIYEARISPFSPFSLHKAMNYGRWGYPGC